MSVLVPGSHPAVFWVGDWFVSGGQRGGRWGRVPRVSILLGLFTSAGRKQPHAVRPHHCAPFTSVLMASSLSCALYYVAGAKAMLLGSWLEAITKEELEGELAKARAGEEELKGELAKARTGEEELKTELLKVRAELAKANCRGRSED